MVSTFAIVLSAVIGQTAGRSGLERQTIGLLKSVLTEFAIECEYEVSTYRDPQYAKPTPVNADGLVSISLSRLIYQTDQSYKHESVFKDLNRADEAAYWVNSLGSKGSTYEKARDEKYGRARILPVKGGLEYSDPAFFSIFPLPRILKELDSPYAEVSWMEEEMLLNCRCRKLKIRHGKNQPIDQGRSSVYWLDLSKNGLLLRHDYFQGKDLIMQRIVNNFQRIEQRNRTVWIPIDAYEYGFLAMTPKKERICLTTPTGRSVFHVMAQSVQLFPRMDASRFALTFPPGTTVKDLITKKTYEVGQDRRPPPKSDAETKQRLIEYLAQAYSQAKEVRAPSLERGDVGASTLTVVSWVLGSISAVTLVFLAIRRIKNG